MKIVDEIINLLSSDAPDLTGALFKSKVLFHKLGETEPAMWVNSELTGYTDQRSVPEYRIFRSAIVGNIANAGYQHNEQPLALSHLKESLRKNLESSHLTQSIAVIEELAKDDKSLSFNVAPEYYSKLSEPLGGGFIVQRAWGKLSAGSMTQVVTEVRSRLLDFVLQLSDKLPEEFDERDMKEVSKEVGTNELFQNAVFGHNATIFVGNDNKQQVQNSVTCGDMDSLANFLKDEGIAQEDIDKLKIAIGKDSGAEEHQKEDYGPEVGIGFEEWYPKPGALHGKLNLASPPQHYQQHLIATMVGSKTKEWDTDELMT